MAQHSGLYSLRDLEAVSGPGDIPRDWWDKARVDPDTGRIIFTMPGLLARIRHIGVDADDRVVDVPANERVVVVQPDREVFAVDIRLEGIAVETLFPVATVSAPLKPPRRKGGAKPSPVWQQIFDHFDPLVARKGKFHSLGSAASSVEAWLGEDKRRVKLHHSTLKRGIKNNRPDWFEA